MNNQITFDFSENRVIRDEAIQRAVDSADSKVNKWSDMCFKKLIEFLGGAETFLTEDFVEWCEKTGFPVPAEKRAFGAVIVRAVKTGAIVHTGAYQERKSKKGHMNPAKVWRPLNKDI